jgi:hypothetical protein
MAKYIKMNKLQQDEKFLRRTGWRYYRETCVWKRAQDDGRIAVLTRYWDDELNSDAWYKAYITPKHTQFEFYNVVGELGEYHEAA